MLIWKRRWPFTWRLASFAESCLTPLCPIKWPISWLNSKSSTLTFSMTCLLSKQNNSWKVYKTTKAWPCQWFKKLTSRLCQKASTSTSKYVKMKPNEWTCNIMCTKSHAYPSIVSILDKTLTHFVDFDNIAQILYFACKLMQKVFNPLKIISSLMWFLTTFINT